jgi:hypothetical protein
MPIDVWQLRAVDESSIQVFAENGRLADFEPWTHLFLKPWGMTHTGRVVEVLNVTDSGDGIFQINLVDTQPFELPELRWVRPALLVKFDGKSLLEKWIHDQLVEVTTSVVQVHKDEVISFAITGT